MKLAKQASHTNTCVYVKQNGREIPKEPFPFDPPMDPNFCLHLEGRHTPCDWLASQLYQMIASKRVGDIIFICNKIIILFLTSLILLLPPVHNE